MPQDQAAPPALPDLASRLTDLASGVAREAEAAAAAIRALTEQAHHVAAMAAALNETATQLEMAVSQHSGVLTSARDALAGHRPAVDALERSPDRLATISKAIQLIAHQSKMLSLNARIEAARSGPEARGFAAVASEMSELARRTHQATNDIGQSAGVIAEDVQAARAVVLSQDDLVTNQATLLGSALDYAARQRGTASALATLASDSAARVSAAASSIGRVGASAVAVRLLAREIAKRA